MASPPRDPAIDDVAPTASVLTAYDERHAITCLHLLDAEAEGADRKGGSQNCAAHRDPAREPGRARRAWENADLGIAP